ncbi:MAG: hypothetical protein N3A54_03900 [Patescibacteria group bacterium]|nr:hypothetical protein [Patescibacteria group bacterium]
MKNTLEILRDFSIIVFFLSLASLSVRLIQVVENIDKRTEILAVEAGKTLQSVRVSLDQLNNTQLEILKRTKSVEKNLFQRVDSIEKNLFTQTQIIVNETARLNQNLEEISKESVALLQQTTETTASLKKTIEDTNKTVALVNQNFDCEINSFCTPNLVQETLLSVRNVSQDANRTFLLLNESVPQYNAMAMQITKNVEEITKNVAKLTRPKWYDRLVSSIIAGAAVTASVKK